MYGHVFQHNGEIFEHGTDHMSALICKRMPGFYHTEIWSEVEIGWDDMEMSFACNIRPE